MFRTLVQTPRSVRLGDFTTDRRLFPLVVFGICAGTFGVIAGWILLRMIGLINDLAYYGTWSVRMLAPGGVPQDGHPALWTISVPVGGALLIGLMARYGSEKIRGHGIPEAIEAILLGGARLDLRVAILKPISSAISIGTGGPFGAEGPIIMTGVRLVLVKAAIWSVALGSGTSGGVLAPLLIVGVIAVTEQSSYARAISKPGDTII